MKKLVLMLMLLAPMTMMAQKFGKVNTQTIMQALPDVAKANGELEALQKQKDNELKAMQEEFQRKADEYQKGASTMNATAKQQKETELQGLQQKIQQAYQDGQQELQKKSNELMQPIVAKVRAAIDAVGKAGNYTYIFEEGAAIYTGSNVLDVTLLRITIKFRDIDGQKVDELFEFFFILFDQIHICIVGRDPILINKRFNSIAHLFFFISV